MPSFITRFSFSIFDTSPFLICCPLLLSTFLTNPTVFFIYSGCICFTLDLFTPFLSLTCCLILSATHYCFQSSFSLYFYVFPQMGFFSLHSTVETSHHLPALDSSLSLSLAYTFLSSLQQLSDCQPTDMLL